MVVKGLVLSGHVFGVSSDIPGQFCPLQVISSFISLEARTLQKFHLKNLAMCAFCFPCKYHYIYLSPRLIKWEFYI